VRAGARPTTALPARPHGGDAERQARRLGVDPATILDLSLSLNPLAPDLGPLLARHLDAHRRYPDDGPTTEALAATIGVDPDRLVVTNGGAEAIALVARLHPVGRVDEPEFSLYREHLADVRPDAPRWMSDPRNPTGRLAGPDERAAVRDEAFYALATGRWSRHDPATIVVGSLTKVFACPGLRIGYVLAPDAGTADAVRRLRPAWSLNSLAAAAVPDLLASADLPGWAAGVAHLRAQLVAVLAGHGLAPEPSDANYVWIPDARGLRDRLWPHGVLVRAGASFGFPDAVRVAVPPPDGLARLTTALERSAP
jgi:histidinol-phosphate/aromatic aminotransferase/cobyric acid decarboxylase-like protein